MAFAAAVIAVGVAASAPRRLRRSTTTVTRFTRSCPISRGGRSHGPEPRQRVGSRRSMSPWWVADNGTNLSTLYVSDGTTEPLVVDVEGAPTGQAFNGGTGFVSRRTASGAGAVPVRDRGREILGWNPTCRRRRDDHVVRASPTSAGAVYKGLAMAATRRVFSTRPTSTTARSTSSTAPSSRSAAPARSSTRSCPHGYAPFGIRTIDGKMFVTYAKQDPGAGRRDSRPWARLRRRVLDRPAPCMPGSRRAAT